MPAGDGDRSLHVSESEKRSAPELSPKQQETVVDLARMYANHFDPPILLTRETLPHIIRVITEDLIPRGLVLLDRQSLGPKDSVRTPYFKALEDRDAIYEQARRNIRYNAAYAIPDDQAIAVDREMRNFALTANITHTTRYVQMCRAREQILPGFVNQAIVFAQRTFPGADPEMLRDDVDPESVTLYTRNSSRFVSNYIVAAAFGLPYPWLPNEFLRLVDARSVERALGEANFARIAKIFDFDPVLQPFQEEFLKDLVTQLRRHWLSVIQRRDALPIDEVKQRSFMFNQMSALLYLLPSPTEERRIDLWADDASTIVGGKRVPLPTSLLAMDRNAAIMAYYARRHGFHVNPQLTNYGEATRLWRQYLEALSSSGETLGKLLSREGQLDAEIDLLLNTGALTSAQERAALRILLFSRSGKHAYDAHKRVDDNIRVSEAILASYDAMRIRAVSFLFSLKAQNGGVFPQKTILPDWFIDDLEQIQAGLYETQLARNRKHLRTNATFLSRDFMSLYDGLVPHITDWESIDVSVIRQYLDAVNAAYIAEQGKPDTLIQQIQVPLAAFEDYVRRQIMVYEDIEARGAQRGKARYFLGIYRPLLNYIGEQRKAGLAIAPVPRTFYLLSLQNRSRHLRRIYEDRLMLRITPQHTSGGNTWDAAQLATLEQQLSIGLSMHKIPFSPQDESDAFLLRNVASNLEPHIFKAIHPAVMPATKADYIAHLNSTLQSVRVNLSGKKRRSRAYWDLRDQERLLELLLQAAATNLFPLPAGAGMDRESFWVATDMLAMEYTLRKTLGPLYQERQIASQALRDALLDTALASLQARRTSVREEIAQLRQGSAEQRFLEGMSRLGFVHDQ